LKNDPSTPWLKEVSSTSLQQKRRDFNQFTSHYFNKEKKIKIGRPNFKSKGGRESYRLTNQDFKLDQERSLIRLEKIGYVPIIIDRQIPEDVNYRNVTVSKTPTGKYYVSILVKIEVEQLP